MTQAAERAEAFLASDNAERARSAEVAALGEKIVDAIKTCYDPEIPVNIYELGLIYGIAVDAAGVAGIRMTLTAPGCPAAQSLPVEVAVDAAGLVAIRMTLTSPMCPAAEQLPPEVESKARSVAGVSDVKLDLVWDPPWNPSMMSEAARLDLGMV